MAKNLKTPRIFIHGKRQVLTLLGICRVAGFQGATDKSVTNKKVDLKAVQDLIDALHKGMCVDVPAISRRLRDRGLLTYSWNDDRSRNISITGQGFKVLQDLLKRKEAKRKKRG